MRFALLFFVLLSVSLNLSAQQEKKYVPIQLDLHSGGDQVKIRVDDYTLVFNQDDLLKFYRNHSLYAAIHTIIYPGELLELDEVNEQLNALARKNRCYIPNLGKQINHCFESGQVAILTPQNRQLRMVNFEVQEESFFSRDAYFDPNSGERIFVCTTSLPGCPSF